MNKFSFARADTPSDPKHVPVARPKWLRMYFVLAGFDLLTVCISLFLNHQIMAIYRVSVDVNQLWANRLVAYDKLRSVAGEVNAPGNDVFDSHDAPSESKRMHEARTAFDAHLRSARDEISRDTGVTQRDALLGGIDAVALAMDEMIGEAGLIFSFFAGGDAAQAGSRMATMDRKYAQLGAALGSLSAQVYSIQREHFEQQQGLANQLRSLELVIACAILLMILGAAYYGHRVGQQVDRASAEQERHLREIEAARGAEAANREQAAFLQTLLDTLPLGVALVDKNLEMVVTNRACRDLLDLPAELYRKGTPIETMIRCMAERGDYGPGDPGLHVAQRLALARDPKPHHFERVRHDGVTLDVRGVPLPDASMVWINADISQRKQAEHSLLAARDAAEAGSRAKSAFLAVMSHEIRTPMNAVIGLLELLHMSPLDAEQRETIDTVRESSQTLLRLIDDVLDFSKIESGKLELHLEPASLTQMLDSAQQSFSGVASQKGLLLHCSIDPQISPAVFVDRLRLRQVVNNLLSNAIKFTDRGQVELVARRVGRQDQHDLIRISVRDTGVGIEAESLTRLFEPFSQADLDVERRFGGTGLGLAICKRLASLMGTTIEVKSAPGVGTSFSLTLALQRAEPAQLQSVRPMAIEAIAKSLQGRTAPSVDAARAAARLILVVDDHPVNRRMLARQLNALGYAAQTAADGVEALELLRGGGFGLVITDCQMPGMDGYQLAAAIRGNEEAASRGSAGLPIIACTANVSREAIDACHSAGMNEALTKPVKLATLQQMLDRWLPATDANRVEPMPEPLATDFVALTDLAQGDATLERDLLDDFQQSNTEDLGACAQAVQADSADAVRRIAHRIKGAARTVGAVALARAAADLEHAAQKGDSQSIRTHWPKVKEESLRLDERIALNRRQAESA